MADDEDGVTKSPPALNDRETNEAIEHLGPGTIIEGIGDDVMMGMFVFIAVVTVIVGYAMYWYRQRTTVRQTIHPESQQNVEDARQRMQRQRLRDQNWQGRRSANPRQGDITCPICLNDASYAIETNCGHTFCGQCIITYWRHGSWLGAVRCPVCRQQVTILLFSFSEAEVHQEVNEDIREITSEINSYNRRFSGEPRPLMDYIRDLPTLLRHAFSEFFSLGGLVWMFRLRIFLVFVAAILYFISPLDIIPESVFGFVGFLDDLFIVLLLMIYITVIYRNFVEHRAQQAQAQQARSQ
ncbi:E3 ubiquitin-protein ligase RNF170 isoform X2 [Lingula anatina]|uniref:E3 ubiquitin-protein ligase RNF170 n=1 Tax=Lingula anatina TaxID=7574 RepID=A0A1S3JYR0_LINAN|nr:E3 ubiquitin-protein ligase RNF170 isoform X2 [Lingula anatina]|eukprot:XP_013415214.1 E3 ubiquitin-protein ligase RNF170 isoform X2 [Lingula anatina]